MNSTYRDFLKEVKPIVVKEPLAETLGAVSGDGVIQYSFIETVKMAGHACPTVAGAYLACQAALEKLYPDGTPVRGGVAVTVYGEPDEGVFGVIGQVFSFVTGAAPATGFKGLGPKFKRKDLLKFSPAKPGPQGLCFEFKRLDNGKIVLVKLYPGLVPFAPDKARRMRELMERVVWEAARQPEKEEFQNLWMEKVRTMLIERKDIDRWLKVEEK